MKHKNVILIEFGNLKDIFTQKNRVIFRPRWLDNGSKKAAEIIYLIALPKNSNSEKNEIGKNSRKSIWPKSANKL